MSSLRRVFVVRLCAVLSVSFAALAIAQVPSAGAKTVNGCEIVDNPTADHHTNCPGAHLANADLSGVDLSYANLSGHTDLFGAHLDGAKLVHANLDNVNMPHVHLGDHADLSHATMNQANMPGADGSHTDLSDAILARARLDGDQLPNADMSRADLTEAVLGAGNFSFAKFDGATFCGTTMPDWSVNNMGCRGPGAKPPTPRLSRSKTFVLPAGSTKSFDLGYPSALKYKRARYYCQAVVSGLGKRYVKILSRRSALGGTVCRVRARNSAKLPSLDTTAKIKVIASTVH